METLAAFVHGALFALHSIAFVYNVRRRNPWDSAVHGLAALYDGVMAQRHARAALEE